MSKCKQCGSKNGKNEIFCGNCGAALGVTAAAAAPQKSINKKLLIGGGVLAVVVLAVVLVLVLMPQKPQTISLDKYVTVEFSGYSTLGEATLQVDWKELKDDLTEDMEAEEKREIKRLLDKDRLVLKLDKYTDLSNGDTVTIELDVDEADFEELGFRFKLEKTEYVVEGLKEAKIIDPFDFLKISYSGYAPYAGISLENIAEDEILQEYMYFSYDGPWFADYGDTFTLYAYFDGPAEEMGYIITRTEMEYVALDVPQLQDFDPFEYLEITFSGVEGDATASYTIIESEYEFMDDLSFYFDRRNYLSTGDEITLSVYGYGLDDYGYQLSVTEKTFVVSGLSTYATDHEDLSEEAKAQLIEYALSVVEEQYKNKGPGAYLYTSIEYSYGAWIAMNTFGSYENVQLAYLYDARYNQWSWSDDEYEIGIIFTFDVMGHKDEKLNGTVYAQAHYNNLILNPDGTLADGWQNKLNVGAGAYSALEILEGKYLQEKAEYSITEVETE